uniref:NADH-ubiquinone oxidoreductase chain 4 n=1 Tax=Scaphidema metallicum TaxID=1586539 RepID=A0A343C3N9_9CUCU|nr:NADH dehydrogenase subunit 4 [Scaphidema metallicum]
MMSVLLMLMFMIPVGLLGGFWFNQFIWFLVSFIFLFKVSFGSSVTNLSFGLGLDLMSFVFILLSFWICNLMILSSFKIYVDNNWFKLYLFFLLILMISLYLTFSSLNLFVFYIFFEVSLVPTFMLVIGWGHQPERLQAGFYLLLYTLCASFPMFISLPFFYQEIGSLNYWFFFDFDSLLFFFLLNMVFMVKVPMVFVHLWLPKAHVEAPISGSMILAGIMLKLGGYGLMRCLFLFVSVGLHWGCFFISLSLIGGLLVSLVCLRQSDMKTLIAYSSVVHMGMVLSGIFTLSYWGFIGSLILMLAHGLCSSGLFCVANLSYERLLSRSLYLNKGLLNILPLLSLFWFLLVSSNMAAPPSLNLLGEIILINSIVGYSSMTLVFLLLISFFSAAYSLFLYSYSQHGELFSGLFSFTMVNVREYCLLVFHWLPLNMLFLCSDMVS